MNSSIQPRKHHLGTVGEMEEFYQKTVDASKDPSGGHNSCLQYFRIYCVESGPGGMKVQDSPRRHIWSNDFQQGCQDHSRVKGQSLHQMVLVKLDIPMQKNEVGSLSYTSFKK